MPCCATAARRRSHADRGRRASARSGTGARRSSAACATRAELCWRRVRGLPRPSGAARRLRAGRCRRPPGARPRGGRGRLSRLVGGVLVSDPDRVGRSVAHPVLGDPAAYRRHHGLFPQVLQVDRATCRAAQGSYAVWSVCTRHDLVCDPSRAPVRAVARRRPLLRRTRPRCGPSPRQRVAAARAVAGPDSRARRSSPARSARQCTSSSTSRQAPRPGRLDRSRRPPRWPHPVVLGPARPVRRPSSGTFDGQLPHQQHPAGHDRPRGIAPAQDHPGVGEPLGRAGRPPASPGPTAPPAAGAATTTARSATAPRPGATRRPRSRAAAGRRSAPAVPAPAASRRTAPCGAGGSTTTASSASATERPVTVPHQVGTGRSGRRSRTPGPTPAPPGPTAPCGAGARTSGVSSASAPSTVGTASRNASAPPATGGRSPPAAGTPARLDDAGQAFCWGHNTFGEVGDGTIRTRSAPVRVDGGADVAPAEHGVGPDLRHHPDRTDASAGASTGRASSATARSPTAPTDRGPGRADLDPGDHRRRLDLRARPMTGACGAGATTATDSSATPPRPRRSRPRPRSRP